jgi:hypothetical protein
VPDISCPAAVTDPALAAADWLEKQPPSAFGAVDQRAFAILSFAAAGAGADRARELLAAMATDLPTAVYDDSGALRPGAAALYVLAALALGEDPQFGAAALLDGIADSIRPPASEPVATPTVSPVATPVAAGETGELAESGTSAAGTAAVGALLLLGGLALMTAARRAATD